jgi:hypothetical protein
MRSGLKRQVVMMLVVSVRGIIVVPEKQQEDKLAHAESRLKDMCEGFAAAGISTPLQRVHRTWWMLYIVLLVVNLSSRGEGSQGEHLCTYDPKCKTCPRCLQTS